MNLYCMVKNEYIQLNVMFCTILFTNLILRKNLLWRQFNVNGTILMLIIYICINNNYKEPC